MDQIVRLVVATPTTGPVVPEGRERVSDSPAVTVGYHAARAVSASATDWRNCASAAASVWLETWTCSSRASSCGSANPAHQLPRLTWSRGWAGCQAKPSL